MIVTNILGTIDRKTEICKKKISLYQKFIEDLFYQWFVDFEFPDETGKAYKSNNGPLKWNNFFRKYIPTDWRIDTLDSYVYFEKGISYTSTDIGELNGLPMINLASIDTSRNYKPSEIKTYSGSYSKSKLAYPGELLIACTDITRNADIIGSPIMIPWSLYEQYLFTMDLVKITPNETINPFYLYMTLRTDYYHKYIKGFASGTTVLHLDVDGIKWYPIWLPPKNLQDKYANLVMPLQKQIGLLYKEIDALSLMKNMILPLLMNGQAHFN